MYPINTIYDILRHGVDTLAKWLEYWISTPVVRVPVPSGTSDFFFFQTTHHLLFTNSHIRKNGHNNRNVHVELGYSCENIGVSWSESLKIVFV